MPAHLLPVLRLVAVLALVLAAAATDLRTRRIPNALTVPALLVALALAAPAGWTALGAWAAGAALGLLLGAAVVALGGMGGGDAKLLAAVGAFLGPQGFLTALLWTALAGGALSMMVVIRRRLLARTLSSTRALLTYGATAGRAGERVALGSRGAVSVPYAVAIAVGTCVALWIRGGL